MIPPDVAGTPKEFWYHLRVAFVACAGFLGLLAFAAFAFGAIPGFDGFARTADVKALTRHVVDTELLDLRTHHCKATTNEAKDLYWGRIEYLMLEYQRASGQPYNLPMCSDL